MDAPRKPLAKLESKEGRVAFRIALSLQAILAEAAVAEGDDFSTYCRDCMMRGHIQRQSEKLYKATVG